MTHPVVALASEISGFTPGQIASEQKNRELAAWRHRCFLVLRGRGLTYPAIGRIMDRHHTSVIHGCANAVQRIMRSDAEAVVWRAFVEQAKGRT